MTKMRNDTKSVENSMKLYINNYENKIRLAEQRFAFDVNLAKKVKDELQSTLHNLTSFIIFLSLSDGESRAKVLFGVGKTLQAAWLNVTLKGFNFIAKNKFKLQYMKIDIVNKVDSISIVELPLLVKQEKYKYFFRKGISLDTSFNTAFLEAEINANNIIEYNKSHSLDLDRMNDYLKITERIECKELPSELLLFSCRGYICDDNQCYELYYNQDLNYGRRVIQKIDKEYAKELIEHNSQYLRNLVQHDGKFIYGFRPITDTELSSYNMLRHTGAIWSLICQYKITGSKDLISVIDRTIDFLFTQIEYMDEQTAFVVERKSKEIKLGGNSIAVIALVSYMEEFKTDKYIDIVNKLGNGILHLLDMDSGKYYHVLYFNEDGQANYSKKEPFRTIFYEGESTFALTKLYGYLGDEKWLRAAKLTADRFIKENYIKYKDHWIAYSMNEITKYAKDERYFEFGLRNVNENLNKLHYQRTTSHIYLELLTATFELYNRMIENNIYIPYMERFNKKQFLDAIFYRAEFMLSGYFYPEYAMYFKSPDKIMNTFFVRHENYRIRIDDIQHFIGGYYNYYMNYDKINLLLNENDNPIGLRMGVGWSAEGLSEFLSGKWVSPPPGNWNAIGFAYRRNTNNFAYSTSHKFIPSDRTVIILESGKLPHGTTPKINSNVVGIITPQVISNLPDNLPQLIVDDIKKTPLKLAEITRKHMKGKIIGITGSVGKTSTKEMLSYVLKSFGSVRCTFSNKNNRKGLYEVLASCADNTEYAVLEQCSHSFIVNKNPHGKLLSPHFVIITPICLSNPELGFKDEFDVAKVKSKICEHIQPNGVCFIPYEMASYYLVREIVSEYGATPVSYGFDENADLRITKHEITKDGSILDADIYSEKVTYKLPIFGKGQVTNSLPVLGVVHQLGLDVRKAAGDLRNTPFPHSRQEIISLNLPSGTVRIINDCFNSQPLSIFEAINSLNIMPNPNGRKIAVMGPSGTLEDIDNGYSSLVQPLINSSIDFIYLVGEKVKKIAQYLPKEKLVTCFDTIEDVVTEVAHFVKPNDLVLVKISSNTEFTKKNTAHELIKKIKGEQR